MFILLLLLLLYDLLLWGFLITQPIYFSYFYYIIYLSTCLVDFIIDVGLYVCPYHARHVVRLSKLVDKHVIKIEKLKRNLKKARAAGWCI